MRKAAIIGMATFYLLLTTGMFVCMVHCAAETLSNKPAMQMMHAAMQKPAKMKGCDKNGDCKCCKQHGNYDIKENIKPASNNQSSYPLAVAYLPTATAKQFDHARDITTTSWTDSNAPPWKTGKLLSIQFHSFQI